MIKKTIIWTITILFLFSSIFIFSTFLILYHSNVYDISLVVQSDKEITLQYGEEYTIPTYHAYVTDNVWNQEAIEIPVQIEGYVNDKVIGDYLVTYTATYKDASAKTNRFIHIVDSVSPQISLLGDDLITIEKNSEYVDPGCTAIDNYDGNITDVVSVESDLNLSKDGSYTIKYTAIDSSGNQASVYRSIIVYTPLAEKKVYLTFDDGPGPYTLKLLNILDKYQIKATFFVTDNFPHYRDLIAEEAKRGHTVAIHTASHKYKTVYANESAYWNDVEEMNQIVYDQTGSYASIIRFPGGSSNQICSHELMDTLIQGMDEKGYRYCDWNVSTGDGGKIFTTEDVYLQAINGMQSHQTSIILQHDIKYDSVAAVEDIIVWGLDHGYTFLPMDDTTEMIHHRE